MTKHVCEISHLNSKRLLRKLQKMLGGYFFCCTLYIHRHLLLLIPKAYTHFTVSQKVEDAVLYF